LELFAAGPVRQIHIELSSSDVKRLRREPRTYVRAVVKDGDLTLTNVGLRVKDRTGSFRPVDDKPSLTLNFAKFSPDQRFYRLRKVHLNNSVQDPSYLHESLGTQLFMSAGIPAPRTSHALVTLNQRPLGLYVLKEGFAPEFLGLHFERPDGNLYENRAQPAEGVAGFQMRRSSGSGPSGGVDLQILERATQQPDLAQRWRELSGLLDVDRFMTFMAMELMMGHRDGYCLAANNYRLYHDPGTDRFVFIPHGMDQLFGQRAFSLLPSMGGAVARGVMEIPQARRLYRQRLTQLHSALFRPEQLTQLMDDQATKLLSAVQTSVRADLDAQIKQLRERVLFRAASLAAQLNAPEFNLLGFKEGIAPILSWRAVDVPAGGMLDKKPARDGRPSLRILAGPITSASWRAVVLLERGSYRFEGQVYIAGVAPLPFGKNKGAGLRVSDVQLSTPHQLVGNASWTRLEVPFEVTKLEAEVQLICQLRASQGQAWFDLGSLRLVQVHKLDERRDDKAKAKAIPTH
jgi:hypothetical protein